MEHKIDETFCLEDGTKLEITKSACNCGDCYFFNNKDNHCSRPKNIESCHPLKRKDKEFIIFKRIKDNNMKEKRSIEISLEEAREWYNSGNSFKRELALKAYKEEELIVTNYNEILKTIELCNKNSIHIKSQVYEKLLIVATYLNSIYKKEYCKDTKDYFQYLLTKKATLYSYQLNYKGFFLNKTARYYPETLITFNSEEAAKKAIDILGDELNILFE